MVSCVFSIRLSTVSLRCTPEQLCCPTFLASAALLDCTMKGHFQLENHKDLSQFHLWRFTAFMPYPRTITISLLALSHFPFRARSQSTHFPKSWPHSPPLAFIDVFKSFVPAITNLLNKLRLGCTLGPDSLPFLLYTLLIVVFVLTICTSEQIGNDRIHVRNLKRLLHNLANVVSYWPKWRDSSLVSPPFSQ